MSSHACRDDTYVLPVIGCRGNFDFTFLFEVTFFSLLPSLFFLLCALARLRFLSRKPRRVNGTKFQCLKLVAIAVYGALQLTLLVLWSFQSIIRRSVSVTAAALSFVNALVLCWLSHREHACSLQPSTLISVYIIFSLLFDTVQLRTLWLAMSNTAITTLFTMSLLSKAVILLLELRDKSTYLSMVDQMRSPEELSGIVNRSIFYWLNRLIMRGARKVLLADDLYPLCEDISTDHLSARFRPAWEKVKQKRHKHSALIATFTALKWAILSPVLARLILIAFTISQPMMLRTLLDHLQKPEAETSKRVGHGLIGAYALVYLGLALTTGFYWSLHFRALAMIRGCLVSAIYQKTTELSLGAIDNTSAAVTLMSADVERIVLGLKMGHEIWAGLFQVGLATWLLEGQLGIACLAPIIIAISCGFAATWVSRAANGRQKRWMEAVQIRIGVTSAMLSSMRAIKMTGLTDRFRSLIRSLRLTEIGCVNQFRMLQIWTSVIAFTPDLVAPVATFAVYVLRARSSGEILDVSRLFTSVSLLVLLTLPLNQLFQSIPLFLAAVSCFGRIGDFLCEEVRVDHRVILDAADWHPSDPKSRYLLDEGTESIELHSRLTRGSVPLNAPDLSDTFISEKWSCGWTKQSEVLKAVDISVPRAKLTLIVGPVGSGKSTLCKALLGETLVSESYVRLNEKSRDIAFCDQTPYLVNASIQQNIIGYSPLERKWYDTVVRAAALDDDLASMPHGDQQLIGSNGVNLSGGQKHKVAIARAVYARKRVAIFDDVLSGLDATSEGHVFLHIFGPQGLLRQHSTTVILSTHAVKYLPSADHIVALGLGGKVMEQGNFVNLNSISGYVQSLSVQTVAQKESTVKLEATAAEPIPAFRPIDVDMEIHGKSRQEGEFETYRYYFRAAGFWNTATFVASGLIHSTCFTFPSIWLKWWTDASARHGNSQDGMYLGIYGLLQTLALLFLLAAAFQAFTGVAANAGIKLHDRTLQTVLNASMAFFSKTDTGVITNKFSQDMQYIDGELPPGVMTLLLITLVVIAQAILITIASPFVGLAFPILLIVFYFIQKFYLRTSRQLRFLDLEAKSPLYTHFLETLSGLCTIRAFGWVDQSVELNKQLLDASQNPNYLLYMIQRWLTFVLDIIVAVVAVIIVTLAVKLGGSSAFAGVALTQVMFLNLSLREIILTWTDVETSISSVSRVKDFSENTSSEHLREEVNEPPKDWPLDGRVEMHSVVASYESKPEAPALKNLSLSIKPGEKLGICGRSGSGKSSLILSLFRMIEMQQGSITIDDIDISTLPRETIRQRLNAVPQDPYLLFGTIRLNLDPYEQLQDSAMITALTKVGLWDNIEAKGGLDADMKVDLLSHGQRQLFCLARAILRPGKIVVLDEVTSSVDHHTDALMQGIIRHEFRDRTIIAVAHRLDTIMDFDRIAVMHAGRLVECDTPQNLLARPESAFRRLRECGGGGGGTVSAPLA